MPEYTSPTPDTLATYLGAASVDDDRASLLIRLAESVARSIVDPLPNGADVVILSATARAYVNPTQSTSQTAGPFNVAVPFPGVYLTRGEKRTLRSLAGQGGGAFTIDPTPEDALEGYLDPLSGTTLEEAERYALNEGNWY